MLWSDESQKKVIFPKDLKTKVTELRSEGKTIVTLNGSFDLLHAGHMQIIYEASQMGDILIVALNTDESIQRYKRASGPIISLKHRLEMMAALQFVSYVTWFDETDPIKILSEIAPDIHVNGSEYGENCIEADTVRKLGGKLHLVQRIPSLSTTEIIEKIRKREEQ